MPQSCVLQQRRQEFKDLMHPGTIWLHEPRRGSGSDSVPRGKSFLVFFLLSLATFRPCTFKGTLVLGEQYLGRVACTYVIQWMQEGPMGWALIYQCSAQVHSRNVQGP